MRGASRGQQKMRVFIADDSFIVVERLVDILRQIRGIEVIGCASDGPRAAQSIERLDPDAVILDLQMREGSGLDVLRAVKKNSPTTTVIVLTNFTYPQYRKRCLDAGADLFLDKSTDFQKLPQILGELLENSVVGSPSY